MSEPAEARGLTHARAALLWLGLFALFCAPFLRGDVVFPHDNARELGAAPESDEGGLSNRFFSDLSSVYVPELAVHLDGARSGWIATWNPHVELGRPAGQLAGLGKAYWPTHLASFVFDDPVRALTWLTVLALLLAGAFAYGLLRELGLGPLACFTGAVAASLGVYPLFWLTFAVHLWSVTWTLGLLWASARFARAPSFGCGLLVAFVVHSMLLSAYPQAIVWTAYLAVPFALVRARRPRPIVGLALAAAVGALSSLPVWLDVALEMQRSARGEINASYFLPSLPRLRGVVSALGPLGRLVDPFLSGNPVDPERMVEGFKGASLGPALAAVVLLALGAWRRTWGLWLLVLVALAMTLRPILYLFAVERLGLGLSRFPPLAGALVPLILIVAHGVERAADPALRRRGAWAALACVPFAVALLGAVVPWSRLGQSYEPPALATGYAVAGALVTAGAAAFVATRRAWLWVVVVAASSLGYGWKLALVRPREEVRDTSPAVEALRELTADGMRYAVVGARVRILPPNEEAWLGLSSVHTYDSLVSRAYREWTKRVSSEGMEIGHEGAWDDYVEDGDYGRQFRRLKPPTGSGGGGSEWKAELTYAGVSVLLSKGQLDEASFEAIGGDLYRPREAPVLQAQLEEEPQLLVSGVSGPIGDYARLPVERVEDRGDRLRLRTSPVERETTLFVSQQFHPRWRATDGGGTALETFPLLEVYQGVRLPAGTSEVTLRFQPWVRFAWLPQLAFAFAGAVLLVVRLRRSPG